MRKLIQALSEERAAEGSAMKNATPGLTKEQQAATIRKWAGWIMEQQKIAAKGKPLEDNKPHNGSPG
jgi:hypothetical protein